MAPRKTWAEKMEGSPDLPKIEELPPGSKLGSGRMVVPKPSDVFDIMKRVPQGAILTVAAIRRQLAQKYSVDTACPLTTGIFIWMCANYADEIGDSTFPYWRTVRSDGELVKRYPGGVDRQRDMLQREGHELIHQKDSWYVPVAA